MDGNFVDWLPSNISTAMCDIAPPGCSMCASFIGNTTAIKNTFGKLADKFTSMLGQKAFLHWYTEEGLKEEEFNSALEKLKYLSNEYESLERKKNNHS